MMQLNYGPISARRVMMGYSKDNKMHVKSVLSV